MTQHNFDDMEFSKGSFFTIMANLEERMTHFETELLKNKNPSNTPSAVSLSSEFVTYKQAAFTTMNAFRQQLEFLGHQVDSIEMRSRRKMLLLHGVTEQKNEDTMQVVAGVLKDDLKLQELSTDDIRRCHRMGRSSGANKPRPILLKLEQVAVRDKIWFTKTKLKGTGKTLSEFLTRPRHELFMAARERFGVSNSWTRQGCVYVLVDGTRHSIASIRELNRLEPDKQKTNTSSKPTATKSKRAAGNKK